MLLVLGIVIAAGAARIAWWPLWALAAGLHTCAIIAAFAMFRRVNAMMRGLAPRAAPIQPEPEEAGDGVPGLGCGERRRVDTDGRTTRTTLDSQP